MTDSLFLVNFTNKYLGKFQYEALRYHVWELIENRVDSTFKHTSAINSPVLYDIANDNKTKYPDTIHYQGLKIYDIEKFDSNKYLDYWNRMDKIRNSEYEHNIRKQ